MNNKDILYLTKHYNEFIYPKPIEDIDEEFINKKKYYLNDPTYYWYKIWPEKPYSNQKLNVLVAGCGTHQAAILAKLNPGHFFVGIDLSTNSIAHQEKLIKKHKIQNLELICNDFREVKLKEKCDLIISSGVIHHLDEPGSALKYFNENLQEDGVISLMVYGNKSIYPVNEIKKAINILHLDHSKKSINSIKSLFERLNPNHPAKILLKNYNDLSYDAGVIDMFLHKSEKFFSIKELINLLSEHNLRIKNLSDGRNLCCTKFFINNTEKLKEIRELNIEDQWQIGQTLNWNDRKIEVNCTKKNNLYPNLEPKNLNIENIYIYRCTDIIYKVNSDFFKITLSNGESYNYNFNFSSKTLKVLELILQGREKISGLLNLYNDQEKFLLKEFFLLLIENNLVDISLHPIVVDKK
jgi:SAM-dependent methyltransferase